jgi:hypothetical protein
LQMVVARFTLQQGEQPTSGAAEPRWNAHQPQTGVQKAKVVFHEQLAAGYQLGNGAAQERRN